MTASSQPASEAWEKSSEAFRTISEVSRLLKVPQHVIRFWEKRFPSLKPVRGSGRRNYYRPEDVHLLLGIRHLLHEEGYTIKGVQKLMRERGKDFVEAAASQAKNASPKRAGAKTAPVISLDKKTRGQLARLLNLLEDFRAQLPQPSGKH